MNQSRTPPKPDGVRIARRRRRRWCGGLLVLGVLATAAAWCALRSVSLPAALFQPLPAATEFVDCQERSLRAVYGDEGLVRRVEYAGLPKPLIDATLAAEDKRFWRHRGVDGLALARATWDWARRGQAVSGASTITQQLIKLAHPRPRTLRVKLSEAAQALRLEQLWDKPRILTEYFNRLDYGNLCRGPAEAARFYFGKPLAELTVAEAAFLAGLPQAPGRLNPLRHPERARKRQQWILDQMALRGYLSAHERARLGTNSITLVSPRRAFEAPHFVDLVMARSEAGAQRDPPSAVQTTLNLDWNRFAEQVLRRQLARLQAERVHNGAVVVIENASGAVRALVGSENFFAPRSGQVNGAWARRSGGSTLKPFTYLLAFEQGATAASIVADVPTEFPTSTGSFRPQNYDRRYLGPVRYRLALANSLNVAAVAVLESVGGPEVLRQRLARFGLTTLEQSAPHYGLGLTIGNAEVRLLELVNAYAALARLGEFRPYRLVAAPDAATQSGRRVADAGAAWLIADILSDNRARTYAFGADSDLRFDFRVACKTGTSSDYRDNWAIGYTPEFTVGVWVGNFDGSPMRRVSGVTGAAPVMREVIEFLHALRGTSWYRPFPGTVACTVDPLTGRRLLPDGDGAGIREVFPAGVLPPAASPADYDLEGRVKLPSVYRDWADSPDNWLRGQIVIDDSSGRSPLRIVTPLPGATYFIDPDLPDASRWLRLRAEGCAGAAWDADTLQLKVDAGIAYARLVEGRHRLLVRDPTTGADAETWINVRAL